MCAGGFSSAGRERQNDGAQNDEDGAVMALFRWLLLLPFIIL